jgi:S1-C subfamily serine protease
VRKLKRMVLGALCIILSSSSFAGAQDLSILLMESTFRIVGPAAGEGKFSVGTVFFVSRPLKSGPNRASHVMVTAAHVLQDISGDEAVLWLRRKKADGTFGPLEHRLRIRSKGAPLWTQRPGADVAVMYAPLPNEAYVSSLSKDLLATDQMMMQYEVHPGDELLALGFPFGLAANDAGFPILRSGKIASYPLVPAKKYPTFLYDFQVYEGNSGGPVYYTGLRTFGGRAAQPVNFIAGLVSQHAAIDGQRLQLAAVVPAQFIREAIDSLPEPP